jgi:dihydrofolate reductase
VHDVTCSMSASLDGFATGPDGGLDWAVPDEEVFRYATDEVRRAGVHLLGRRLHEAMLVWETADRDPSRTDAEREFAALWQRLPKVVFSSTLAAVEGSSARLATGSLEEEVARLRAEPGNGDIAVGGPALAAAAAAAGLVDEWRVRVHPVLVGGGTPLFPHHEQRVGLDLVETRTFGSGVVLLRYRTPSAPRGS